MGIGQNKNTILSFVHCLLNFPLNMQFLSAVAQWYLVLDKTEGPRVRASRVSLCCGP